MILEANPIAAPTQNTPTGKSIISLPEVVIVVTIEVIQPVKVVNKVLKPDKLLFTSIN